MRKKLKRSLAVLLAATCIFTNVSYPVTAYATGTESTVLEVESITQTGTSVSSEAVAEEQVVNEEGSTEKVSITEAQTESAREAEPEPEAQTGSVSEVEAELETQAELVSEGEPELEPQTNSVSEAEPELETQTESVSEVESELETHTESASEINEATTESESQTETVSEMEPTEAETESYEYVIISEDDKTCEISGYSGNVTSTIIPTEIDGYTLVGIAAKAFYGCSELTEITIPESVITIGDSAFFECSKVESVIIPANVTSIGASAFAGCTSLSILSIPEGVTSIGEAAFSKCTKLNAVTVPGSVQEISDKMFYQSGVQYVTIGNGVEKIGDSAFYGCALLQSVIIPESVQSIGASAFYGCKGLKSVKIPKNVTEIGNSAFYGCEGITTLTISDGVESIGASAFQGCVNLTSVAIPDSVTSLGNRVFSFCMKLTMIDLPSSITTLSDYVFSGCSSLNNVKIPDGVECIGNSVFSGCTSLSTIDIPLTVTKIGNGAFEGCGSLENINLPEGISSVGVGIFRGCTNLKELIIPNSLTALPASLACGSGLEYVTIYSSDKTVIPNAVFIDCKNLTTLKIIGDIGKIEIAFSGCTSLTTLDISGNVEVIGSLAFLNCDNLETVHIGGNVGTIETQGFSMCDNLESVYIGGTVGKIGQSAFNECGNLKSISMAGVSVIDDYAFYRCKSLVNVGSLQNLTEIGFEGFMYCSSLTSIELPDTLTTIETHGFECSGLTSITIPASITSMGEYVFWGCKDLQQVNLVEGLQTIGNCTFNECTSIREFVIPESVKYGNSFLPYNTLSIVNNSSISISDLRALDYDYINASTGAILTGFVPAYTTAIREDVWDGTNSGSSSGSGTGGSGSGSGGGSGSGTGSGSNAGATIIPPGINNPDPDKVTVKNNNQYNVQVYDYETKEPLAGAKVLYGSSVYRTDSKGFCTIYIFDKSKDTITISKNGYYEKEYELGLKSKNYSSTVALIKNETNEFFELYADYCGKLVNLFTKKLTVDLAKDTIPLTLSGKIINADYTMNEIVYKVNIVNEFAKDGEITTHSYESSADKELPYAIINENTKLYMRAYDPLGNMLSEKLIENIVFKDSSELDGMTIVIGEDLDLNIDYDGFLWKGHKLELDKYPFKIAGSYSTDGTVVLEYKFDKDFGKKPVILNIAGTLTGEGNKNKLSGNINANATITGEDDHQAPHGIVIGAKVEGKADGNAKIAFDFKEDKYLTELMVKVAAALELRLGLGVADVISAGIYGSSSVILHYVMLSNYLKSGVSQIYHEGELGLFIKTSLATSRLPLVDGTHWIYLRENDFIEEVENTYFNVLLESIYYEDNVYSSATNGWNGVLLENVLSVIENDINISVAPQILYTDNGTYMFFIDNSFERNNNVTALKYSKFDESTNTWCVPVEVLTSQEMDSIPVTYVHGNNIYIMWQSFDTTGLSNNTTNTTVADIMKTQKLKCVVLSTVDDTITVLDTSTIDDNENYKVLHTLVADSEGTKFIWYENTADNMFGMEGTNIVKMLLNNVESTLFSTDKIIIQMKAFNVGNVSYLAYTTNESGEFINPERLLHIRNLADGTEITFSEYNPDNIQVVEWNETDAIVWYCAGNVYLWEGSDVTTVAESLSGMNHKLITSKDGNHVILSESAQADGQRDIYYTRYNAADSTWTYPVNVSMQDNYAEAAAAFAYGTEDDMAVVYRVTTVSSDMENISAQLCMRTIESTNNITLTDAQYENAAFAPSSDFTVLTAVRNTGSETVDGVTVRLMQSGTVVAEYVHAATLKSGEEIEISALFQLPENVTTGTYELVATCDGDVDEEDSTKELELGRAEVYVTADKNVINSVDMLSISVTNVGLETTGGKVVIYDFDTDTVYKEFKFKDLAKDYHFVLYSDINFPEIALEGTVGVRVETDAENYNADDCWDCMYFSASENVVLPEKPIEPPTEAPTEEPTETPTEKPTETPTEEPTEAPTEAPTEEPTETPTEGPSETPDIPSTGETGIILCDDGKYHYLVDGETDTTKNGLTNWNGTWYYLEDGIWITDKYDFVDYNGASFLVANGVIADLTGLVLYDGIWYYLANGQLINNYEGLTEYDGEWFYVKNGILVSDFNGIKEYDGGLFLVAEGRILFAHSGLYQNTDGTWYFIASGQVQTQYTGLALYDNKWFYVVSGILAVDYTGWVEYNGSAFQVINGMVAG